MSELREAARDIISDVEIGSPPPRKRGRPRKVEVVQEPYIADPASIASCSVLANILWNVSCRFTKWEPLSDEERQSLGEALDPLFHKYMPFADKWREEINFAIILTGVISIRLEQQKPKPKPVSEAEEVAT